MLKHCIVGGAGNDSNQPPSGGCVLKQSDAVFGGRGVRPAAFRRLCVETVQKILARIATPPSRLQAAVC